MFLFSIIYNFIFLNKALRTEAQLRATVNEQKKTISRLQHEKYAGN